MEEKVILVDELDNEIGLMNKLEAHQKSLLHRAFSIFIFNDKKELLLQQRAKNKYHSALLWTNTCCSHPRPNETLLDAASRRIMEEMGINCNLNYRFNFIYQTSLENNLFENELDHVYTGLFNGSFQFNKEEVNDFKWISLEELKKEVDINPENYTVWFKIIIKNHLEKII
ncbi:MAG: isopentenyl-diphosphate Delta-isomerase [Solirubrobacteraceae bacterium]